MLWKSAVFGSSSPPAATYASRAAAARWWAGTSCRFPPFLVEPEPAPGTLPEVVLPPHPQDRRAFNHRAVRLVAGRRPKTARGAVLNSSADPPLSSSPARGPLSRAFRSSATTLAQDLPASSPPSWPFPDYGSDARPQAPPKVTQLLGVPGDVVVLARVEMDLVDDILSATEYDRNIVTVG